MSKFLDEYGLARVWQNIKSYIQQNSGSSVDIPSGIICAWSGTESNTPPVGISVTVQMAHLI